LNPIAFRTPARSTAAHAACASRYDVPSGFSDRTALPAEAAASAISAWVPGGVQMSTMSMSSRATSSRQSVVQPSAP